MEWNVRFTNLPLNQSPFSTISVKGSNTHVEYVDVGASMYSFIFHTSKISLGGLFEDCLSTKKTGDP